MRWIVGERKPSNPLLTEQLAWVIFINELRLMLTFSGWPAMMVGHAETGFRCLKKRLAGDVS